MPWKIDTWLTLSAVFHNSLLVACTTVCRLRITILSISHGHCRCPVTPKENPCTAHAQIKKLKLLLVLLQSGQCECQSLLKFIITPTAWLSLLFNLFQERNRIWLNLSRRIKDYGYTHMSTAVRRASHSILPKSNKIAACLTCFKSLGCRLIFIWSDTTQ